MLKLIINKKKSFNKQTIFSKILKESLNDLLLWIIHKKKNKLFNNFRLIIKNR